MPGCGSGISKDKPLTDYIAQDTLVIGLSSYTVSTKINQKGQEISGFSLDGVCLIRNQQELEAAQCKTYAIVREVVARALLESRFWEQVREEKTGPGSPFYDVEMIPVTFVTVDEKGRIQDHYTKSGAHFTISVNTNEFTKLRHY